MAPARVSFAPPPLTDSGQSSPASPALTLESAQSDETTADMSELIAIPDDTAHLIIARERLTVVGKIATNYTFDILSATLDEDSQPPRNVTVRKIHQSICSPVPAEMPVTIARFIEVWKDLKHPNVLRLLGYTIFCGEVNQLVSPSLINGDIRDFLNKAPVGVAQRLGFVRDVAAGLDYLHSQRPPICHSNLDPRGILIDENFNAVLTDFKVDDVYLGPWAESRYMSPEKTLEESEIVASDVWAWGCVAFEILTDRRPFDESEGDVQIVNSVIQRKAPGQPDMLLSLVPNAPKPEYASALRLLYSYLPLCWEYEPKKRPLISLLRHQVFIFSFEEDAGDSVVATLEELAHLLIPPERLRIVECSPLGEGNYGEVLLGTLDEASSTPRDVAVKRLKAVGTRGEHVRLAKRLARELNTWAKIKHPNVVELIGYYLDEKYEAPLLISALVTNGNVLDYIERYKPDIEQRIAFVKGITAGLACLHNFDPAVCHADLKPANVLIDLQMNAMLCDFGLASFVSDSDGLSGLVTTTSLKGTPRYMGPELHLEGDCKHKLESDVWAWACTVFQVLTGRIPYAEITGDVQFYLAMDRKEPPGDVALLLPNDAEVVDSDSAVTLRSLSSILPQCWDFDPQKRPSICTLLPDLFNISPQTGAEASGSRDFTSDDTQTQQVLSDPSSRQETPFNGNEGVASGGLEEGTKLAETSQDPSGNCAEVESAQGYKRDVPTETHPKGDVVDEENSGAGENASAIRRDTNSEAQVEEDDQTLTPITSDRPSLKISTHLLITLISVAGLILSLCVNIFLLLRRVDPLPHPEASRPPYQERDL